MTKLNLVVDFNIARKIYSIHIPLLKTDDNFVWGANANGMFMIKSTTWIQNDIQQDSMKQSF